MAPLFQHFPKLFRSRRGSAATEFALILPTLMVVTLIIFDLGQAFFVYTTVNNVAADGARYAAVRGAGNIYPKSEAEIEAFINDKSTGLNAANLTVTITYTPSNSSGSAVAVQVSYEQGFFLSNVFSTIISNTDSSITISGSATMTVL